MTRQPEYDLQSGTNGTGLGGPDVEEYALWPSGSGVVRSRVGDTSRDGSGRWVSGDRAAELQPRHEETTTLSRTVSRSEMPLDAPDIAGATTLDPHVTPDHFPDSGFAQSVSALDEPVSVEENHEFFTNDVRRGRVERELFDDDDDFDAVSSLDRGAAARRNAIEWVVVLVAAVLLALVLRAFLVQAFWIPSPSMESTLLVDDRVLVNKLSYRLNDIERGDVVVFRRTDEEIAATPSLPADVIKRVIGLPGETIELKENAVYIDGLKLVEPYLDDDTYNADFEPTTVPEGHVFVLGDNRAQSQDSRSATGPIEVDRIVGRAFVLFWPPGRTSML